MPTPPKFYIIDNDALDKLKRVMTRLHSEDRLGGDEMRDLGHAVEVVVRLASEWEYDPSHS